MTMQETNSKILIVDDDPSVRTILTRYLEQDYPCCVDTHSPFDALNKINPDYQARYVFIRNRAGPAHHWVTGFNLDGKVMVMDYGASPEWSAMRGVHGPYESLSGYADFLATLRIRGFAVDTVEWRDMPGQED